jgi:hypothetical protein
MNRLNGWQRIWVVLIVLWALVIGVMGYRERPTYIWHSTSTAGWREPSVVAGMPTKSWAGDDCRSEVSKQPTVSPEEQLKRDKEEMKQRLRRSMLLPDEPGPDIVLVNIPLEGLKDGVTLCFKRGTADPVMERIASEYYEAYVTRLREQQREHTGAVFLVWLVPGLFLYAFGWGVGWIRRGFKK